MSIYILYIIECIVNLNEVNLQIVENDIYYVMN